MEWEWIYNNVIHKNTFGHAVCQMAACCLGLSVLMNEIFHLYWYNKFSNDFIWTPVKVNKLSKMLSAVWVWQPFWSGVIVSYDFIVVFQHAEACIGPDGPYAGVGPRKTLHGWAGTGQPLVVTCGPQQHPTTWVSLVNCKPFSCWIYLKKKHICILSFLSI